jgi:hypothetical protein
MSQPTSKHPNPSGERPGRGATALVRYTGWRQRSGATFFTTRGRAQPIAIEIGHAMPGFAELLPVLHKGERVVLWVPPRPGTPEPVVYELELVDLVAPPPVAARGSQGSALAR